MEKRKQFTFYRSYYEALALLPEPLQLDALKAVINYALDGLSPEDLDPLQKAIFILVQPTLDTGRSKAGAGKQGGSKPKATKKQTESKKKANGKQTASEIENEKEKEKEVEDECLTREGFERFWEMYPVKVAKEQALAAWMEIKPEEATVLDGLRIWKYSRQWHKEGGRFIPRAAKFLKERHYQDAPKDYVPTGASGILGEAELEAIARIMQT